MGGKEDVEMPEIIKSVHSSVQFDTPGYNKLDQNQVSVIVTNQEDLSSL